MVQSLRELRGLSRQELADLTSVSMNTIWRVESAKSCTIKRPVAIRILGALEKVEPLESRERTLYLAMTGIRFRPIDAATLRAKAEMDAADEFLDAAIDRHGLAAVKAAVLALDDQGAATPPPATLRKVNLPEQKHFEDGTPYIEQRIESFTPDPKAKPAARAKAKHKSEPAKRRKRA